MSTQNSRRGAFSRLSEISSTTGYNESSIRRTVSQPQPPPTRQVPPRLVRSAHCYTVTQRRENDVNKLKRASYPCSLPESCNGSAIPKVESEQSKVGVGVFLSVDVIEKGQSAVSL